MEQRDNFDNYADRAVYYFSNLMDRTHYNYTCDYPKYNLYDATVTGNTGVSLVELKCRDKYTFTQFKDCYITYEKVCNLQKESIKTGNKAVICAIYPRDNKFCFWELDNDKEYEWVWRKTSKYEADPESGEFWHRVVLFNLCDAKVVTYPFSWN